jgi:pimeloyl-ACP methyl ester carboxylesterase
MDVKLVTVQTVDGVRLDGALRQPARSGASELGIDAFIVHHGVGGNFYNPSFVNQIGDALLADGCAVLRVSNRGHDLAFNGPAGPLGAGFETVDDCRLDWPAWIDFCHSLGYERIGVWGHSLGAVKTIYFLATQGDPRVRCAVATSPPLFSHKHWAGMAEFDVVQDYLAVAEGLIERGDGESLMSVTTPTPLVVTARTYVDKYGPNGRYNILDLLPMVHVPILVTVGGLEVGMNFAPLPAALARLSAGQPNLAFELVAGADHQYTGTVDALQHTALEWMRSALSPAAAGAGS